LGVARQEEDCREKAKQLGWPVGDVYVDNDVSAYSGKPRPAWQQLLAHVESGTVDAVLSWHVDRLTRSPRELEDVIDLADRRGLALATVTGDIDLQSPTGRMVARLLGASAGTKANTRASGSAAKFSRPPKLATRSSGAGVPMVTP
jgi:site-specific DNA recombinase